VQPRDAGRLTGGSSSGAAASVQEGSALAAIGTDTGGSIRVPAALCGVVGYRSSLSLQCGLWSGGAHLAESFDTVGWLYRDAADGAVLAQALLGIEPAASPAIAGLRIGTPRRSFLHDCEGAIVERMEAQLGQLRERGAVVAEFDAQDWGEAMEIFAPIQASEAARLHAGNFEQIEATIAQRLAWGASLGETEIAKLRLRLANFRAQGRALMERFDLLVLPCSPLAKLEAGADHAQTRARILRYTAPVSLCGWPVVTLPGEHGGLQLVCRMGSDAELLALSARLAEVAAADGGSARLHA
jgi:Asp-tRNA(Asn)/Glu-tRNA(Gln) amidotransferase A subunit family amidase